MKKIPLTINSMKVPANEVVVGDILRFRMSKYDEVQWIQVVKIIPYKDTCTFVLENGNISSHSIKNKSDWATIIPLNCL